MTEDILRPRPRRPFSLTNTPDTAHSSRPSSPSIRDQPSSPNLTTGAAGEDHTSPPSRTRSILNLTSSTLFGIYSPTGYPDKDDPGTPFGTDTPFDSRSRSRAPSQPDGAGLGLDTAAWEERTRRRRSSVLDTSAKRTRQREQLRRQSSYAKKKAGRGWFGLVGRSVALGTMGVCYGVLIGHLHDRRNIAPVKVEGIRRQSWVYLAFWGVVAVALGGLLPLLDGVWEGEGEEVREDQVEGKEQKREKPRRGGWAPEWNDVVRSIGAFVGIAFAIRRLPWQSTLQLSLTLALSNPAIWYLLDRTPPGLVFSTTVALSGTALCLAINPNLIPPPSGLDVVRSGTLTANASSIGAAAASQDFVAGIFSHESVGVATWIASVLFVSCVCFGNIGRRL
ncbi:insulin-induced protein-domain-containing protein [Elsinoe ampelina]|uniref:Insulin-induced protein-domain-containing protein n=1 Tax=Elsinoe ampelina TaxID=302913 RepID=A0A6A6G9D6_9PEZI|nr:insulin-induced protein-domain-containing protein [Elsinoe ampelina]